MIKPFIKKLISVVRAGKIASASLPVFMLHGVIPKPGPLYQRGFHNITPNELHQNIAFLRRNFDIISLDDSLSLAAEDADLSGKCIITIDDGYACLKEYVFPVFAAENIPATVFIISSLSGDGMDFWRDQLRAIILQNRTSHFIEFCQNRYKGKIRLQDDGMDLMKATKSPETGNSHNLQAALNEYFKENDLTMSMDDQTGCDTTFLTAEDIRNAPPCISFGNHTHTHPFLPGLTEGDQFEEIMACKLFLDEVGKSSPYLCLPFGAYDQATLNAAKRAGYKNIIHYGDNVSNSTTGIMEGNIHRLKMHPRVEETAMMILRNVS